MKKTAALLLVLALGCLTTTPEETPKEQKYVFYLKNPSTEGTVNIAVNDGVAAAQIGEETELTFRKDTGDLISYHAKTDSGYIDLQFADNKVTAFEQGYPGGKTTYYYEKNGTRVTYITQDKQTEAYLNFTPKQEEIAGTLLETARAYSAFFKRPDQRYRTGSDTIAGFECDTYGSATETERSAVCYSEKTGSMVIDIAYAKLKGSEAETSRMELRSYLEG